MADTEKLPSEDIQCALKKVVDHFEQEDRAVRERQLRQLKKLKYYWDGFQRLWYSDVAHDWRVWGLEQFEGQDNGAEYYDKRVNIFRSLLESLIAALSVTVPPINCVPDDADNSLDIATAKAGNLIAQLVYKHNDAPLLWIHALYVHFTEGMVACYSYPKEDESYGTYNEPQYQQEEQDTQQQVCPNCGTPMQGDTGKDLSYQEMDEYMPDEDDVKFQDLFNKEGPICPSCMIQVHPELKTEKLIVTKLVGITQKPKTRQCIEVYGGLHVKIANYAKTICDSPYLIYSYEANKVSVLERYEHLRDETKDRGKLTGGMSGIDVYGRWARMNTQYYGEYPTDTVTLRNAWLRPCAFQILPDDEYKILKKKYPFGCKVVMANDCFAEVCAEKLDDCWTVTKNPQTDYLVHEPPAQQITSIQDIINDLVSLTLQTIEHGIPQTFADPGVLNFDQYRQTEVSPGDIYPALPKSGQTVSNAFYEVKTATLSQEVLPFSDKMLSSGQMVSGALPSLYGGVAEKGSETASEYAMQRAQALQRIQTPWKMITFWWKEIFGKVIPSYIKDMVDDERVVTKDASGGFINNFIRKAELIGKIGEIELEAADQLPLTWAQKKDVIMQLLQAANPEVMAAISAPENIEFVAEALGLPEFTVPGEDDRNKQYEEIQLLVQAQPIPDYSQKNPITGDTVPKEKPAVEIDPLVDNHNIHAEICRNWAVSDAGRITKVKNPQGYKNVLLHYQQHIEAIKQATMNQAAMMGGNPQQMQQGQQGQSQQHGQQQPMAAPVKNNGNQLTTTVQ